MAVAGLVTVGSVTTLMQAGLSDATARSMAGTISGFILGNCENGA
jgi:hypothetical protein